MTQDIETKLDAFARSYAEAMLASVGLCFFDPVNRIGIDEVKARPPTLADLSPETLERIVADCARALADDKTAQVVGMTGREFWIMRQKNLLSSDEPQFPPLTVALNDAGQVVFQ